MLCPFIFSWMPDISDAQAVVQTAVGPTESSSIFSKGDPKVTHGFNTARYSRSHKLDVREVLSSVEDDAYSKADGSRENKDVAVVIVAGTGEVFFFRSKAVHDYSQ
jgi:hypothetical protein